MTAGTAAAAAPSGVSSSTSFILTEPVPSGKTRTVIVGAGIVGSCLAAILSAHANRQVVLLDRNVHNLPGSTGHAPGYVGQYNQLEVLTELAKRSVSEYRTIPGGFDVVGGLEVVSSQKGLEGLQNRAHKARELGLPADILTAAQVVEVAGIFVKEEGIAGGLHFPWDGTANAQLIARHQQDQARTNGALILDADVASLSHRGLKLTDDQEIYADQIVLCTGIWTRSLLPELPILPVAHPYAYTADRDPRASKAPFVRYPEHHVYVRDHGPRDGLGSYAHDPIHVATSSLSHSAYGNWEKIFQPILSTALELLPQETAESFSVDPQEAGAERVFNGLFSVTPDGKPLMGQLKCHDRVYVASAIWVTHAAGCAQLLADVLQGKVKQEDEWLLAELDVNRFDGADWTRLEQKALATYNDIYNKNAH